MNVVVDGLPVRGGSLAVSAENLLRGWHELDSGDEIHLLLGPDARIDVPPGFHVQHVDLGAANPASRLWHQSVAIRKVCVDVGADVMLGMLPSTAVGPLPCPRVIIAHDLRHELRKHQFSRRFRIIRGVSYGIGFRQADGIACISSGTRDDLLASRKWLDPDRVRVALWGADHVASWSKAPERGDYAIAFGQYGVKLPLTIVGLRPARLDTARALVEKWDLGDAVTLQGWLPDEEFQAAFSAARLVVFPSDFEGFGMPALEAMRLGIPLVITPERTLLQVTGGFATVTTGWGADEIADAVEATLPQLNQPPNSAAVDWAATFTWRRAAEQVRGLLADIVRASGRLS